MRCKGSTVLLDTPIYKWKGVHSEDEGRNRCLDYSELGGKEHSK